MALMRLDKFLADMGISSRKDLKQIIKSGRVSIDGKAVKIPETKLDPENCCVEMDGEKLSYKKYHYYMIDKPCGVVTATEDGQQKTVLDLVTPEMRRMGLFPVGRLDKDTSGLLLLTDDGDFAHRVISPKSCVEKRYYAKVEGEMDKADIKAFEKGIVLADGTECLPAKLENLGEGCCAVTVMEGKYHQVRRMLASRGKPVLELRRLSIGELVLEEELGSGNFRELTEDDLCRVFSSKITGK
ncbi:MAG: rRNA pseudouridine synthase [Oscillospiraceae bacterium]|nr:rRNA pseudouridine synthase [Oscillospiraceae bacterium]